jgi:uncharacterized protein (TIGR02145 family)
MKSQTIFLLLSILMLSFNNSDIKHSEEMVQIGTQIWTTKNLDVTTYRNGDVIPQVTSPAQWVELTTGAWCYYENKSENGTTYGKLYNWFAVKDSRGLAPTGYHIPTAAEWTILINFLGGETEAGIKMKSASGWTGNGNGNNSSGFTSLPGGSLATNGKFFDIGSLGYWWSSTESSTTYAWNFAHYYRNSNIYRGNSYKASGFSVRCVRD